MHTPRVPLLVSVGACVAVGAVLGPVAAVSAQAETIAPASATPARTAPVTTLHVATEGRLGGLGIPGATVTVTDRTGAVRTTTASTTSGFWFVPIADLRPTLSVTQTVDGVTSAPVTWGEPDDSALAAPEVLDRGPEGQLIGRSAPNARIDVIDRDGTKKVTYASESGFWQLARVDLLRPSLRITQTSGGRVSPTAVWGTPNDATALPPVHIDAFTAGRLVGSKEPGAVVVIRDAAGKVKTTYSSGGRWGVFVLDLQRGWTVTQSKDGLTSPAVVYN